MMVQKLPRLLGLLLVLLVLASCSRSDVGKGLTVTVVDEIEMSTPFGSEGRRVPGADYEVYLTPSDTPLSELARVKSGWTRLSTDNEGRAVFSGIEGRYHAMVDVNGNGRIDQRELNVPSGSDVEIVVRALAGEGSGGNWLELKLDRRTYIPGSAARVEVIGWLDEDGDESILIDLWHQDGSDEERLLRVDVGRFSGDVSFSTEVTLEEDWPNTPEDTANDFLLVPRAFGKYYSGSRFSVRAVQESIAIGEVGLTVNGGNSETVSRNVSLHLEAENAATVAFGEDLDHLFGGATRYPFQTEYGYQLSAGDGPKNIYALFFDSHGNYAGPAEASIVLNAEGPPPPPITNMSLTIDGGASVAPERNVTLSFTADNADRVAFGEDPDALASANRLQFADEYDFQLSAGDEDKTVYALFFDPRGEAAVPVSDSITLRADGPSRPVASLLHVDANPPGNDDFLWGEPGAAHPEGTVRIYSDPYLEDFLGEGPIESDGSFVPVNILDGSDGNVYKPGDYVFVVAVDAWGRVSDAAAVVNDSTPPELYRDQVQGLWVPDALPRPGLGNPGNVFEAYFQQPGDSTDDVAGGFVDLSAFGGENSVPLVDEGNGRFSARVTLEAYPDIRFIDSHGLRISMRLFDSAGNISEWVVSEDRFSADNVFPTEPVVELTSGGNRQIGLTWSRPQPLYRNLDLMEYEIAVTESVSGDVVYENRMTLEEYDEAILAGGGWYIIDGLPNCRDYVVRLGSIDDARNKSGLGAAVTVPTILPPPEFEAWGGVTTENGGVVTFGMMDVPFAGDYQVHYSDESGVPYTYTTFGGDSSPYIKTGEIAEPPYVGRIEPLDTGTLLYLSPRAVDMDDDACLSVYGPEVSAKADLHLVSISDGDAEDSIGGALAASDWTGNGLLDLVVGAPSAREVAVLGPRNDNDWLASFGIFNAPTSYDIPGVPLAVVDLMGDGEPWYIVGSPAESPNDEFLAGKVRVYDSNGVEQYAFDGDMEGLHFGFAVANLGDLDGVNRDKFAVGGFGCLHGDCGVGAGDGTPSQGPGKVVIYGWDPALSDVTVFREHTSSEEPDGAMFGISIFGRVDLNDDYQNVYAIGSPGTGLRFPTGPYVRWYDGETGDVIGSLSRSEWIGGTEIGQLVGAAITAVDDISGNGLPDWIIGAPWRSSDESGEILAIPSQPGNGGDWGPAPLWSLTGTMARASSRFGSVLAAGGDVNGDGVPDVIVGAPGEIQNTTFYGAGSAYAVDAKEGRLTYEIRGGTLDGALGYSTLLPGNLTGEGYDEWVVGAPGSAYGGDAAGRIYVLSSDPDDP